VRLLLGEKQIQPDQQDANYGQTALSWAAGNGHEGVVRLFLDLQFVNTGSRNRDCGEVVQTAGLPFSERNVNPDSSDRHGRTPLSHAAGNGNEGVVQLMLGRKDVNPDSSSKSNQTPLSWAARNGHEGIVKLLLGRKDVNPDTLGTAYGQTPLSWAAKKGHEGTVKLLLGREDINPNSSGKSALVGCRERV